MLNPLFDITPLLSEIEAGTLILTPNNRLASKILDAWGLHQLSEKKQVWTVPPIQAIESWISDQWEQLLVSAWPGADATPMESMQELMVWEEVIEEDEHKPPLLNPAGLAHNALRAAQTLQQWCVESDELDKFEDPGAQLITRWQQAFQVKSQGHNTITRGELTNRITLAFAEAALQTRQRILLVDFQTLSPQHSKLLNTASDQLATFDAAEDTPPLSSQSGVLEFSDATQELQQAACWAKAVLQSEPKSRVGIIIPDLPNRRQQVERVFREVFEPDYGLPQTPRYTAPFNISTATPLASTPIIGDALQLLRLNQYRLPLAEFTSILNSPFWGDAVSELALRAQAEKRLRELGNIRPRGVDFRETCTKSRDAFAADQELPETASCFVDQLNDFENLRRQSVKVATFTQWQQLFQHQLVALGWPGSRPLDSVEHQQLEHWRKLLERFTALDVVARPTTLEQALKQLQRLVETTPFQAETEDSPLQILGLLEGAGLRFDYLWMMGMDDRQWPPAPEPNPLLPAQMQRELGMPRASAERELALAKRLLNTYRNRASQVLLSYCQFEGDAQLAPCDFIRDLNHRALSDLPGSEQHLGQPEIQLRHRPEPEIVPAGEAPGLNTDTESVRGGSSMLKDQANCPFNAFVRWRLGAMAPIEPGSGLSAIERGTILHDLLDGLWEKLGDRQTLEDTPPEQLQQWVGEASQLTLRPWRSRKPELGDHFFELEAERLSGLIIPWLDKELERPSFTVAAREAAVETTFEGLPLTLRIDRIDHTDQGQVILIDYKTGNATVAGWLGERPSEPQLPLYTLLMAEQPAAISFGVINAKQQQFVGLQASDHLLPLPNISSRYEIPEQWSDLLQQWRDALTGIARSYKLGDAELCVYNKSAFDFQDELLPLNRWPEKEQIERYLADRTTNTPTGRERETSK